jgi:hypothetical protein
MIGAHARDRGFALVGSKWEGSIVNQGTVEPVVSNSKWFSLFSERFH